MRFYQIPRNLTLAIAAAAICMMTASVPASANPTSCILKESKTWWSKVPRTGKWKSKKGCHDKAVPSSPGQWGQMWNNIRGSANSHGWDVATCSQVFAIQQATCSVPAAAKKTMQSMLDKMKKCALAGKGASC